MKIYIKHMVSNRCKMVVREELKKLGLHFIFIDLGEVEVMENIIPEKFEKLNVELHKSGLELLDDKNSILIDKIKNTIIDLINKTDDSLKINFNQTLREKFDLDYDCLSELFYDAQGIKIEQFILLYKIERIKEMIIYDELSMNEIAQKLNYINVALIYLQFKKSTGLSPYHFRQMKINRSFMIKSVRDI